MRIFNCLIADDEPIARAIIQNYCRHLDFLKVVAECGNALEAKKIIDENPIDILFLDIRMPVLDGLQLTKTLKYFPQIIFTTAYREHAATAFDQSACDYLLKPFSIDRFIIAVDKAIERLTVPRREVPTSDPILQHDFIFIKTDGKIFKIQFSDLLYCEASGNYSKIQTGNTIMLTSVPFAGIDKLLPGSVFSRIHRSFIINRAKISHIEGNRVFIGKNELPIGSNYKEAFLKSLGL